jgi:hypothetical protein
VVEIHLPSWELSSQRCPACRQQYELIFYTCSFCGRVVLACCLGDTFEIANKGVGAKFYDEDCCAAPDFRPSTWQEIRALGFEPGEYR